MRKLVKHLMADVLALALVATSVFAPIQANAATGTKGSSTNPYTINSAEDLANLQNDLLTYEDTDMYVKMTSDISNKTISAIDIPSANSYRKGKIKTLHFDGAKHSFTNVTFNPNDAEYFGSYYKYCGLFGKIESVTLDIKDLSFINCSASVLKSNATGLIVGKLDSSKGNTITNVSTKGCNVGSSACSYVGGLVGQLTINSSDPCMTIKDATNEDISIFGDTAVGGFVGGSGNSPIVFENVTNKKTDAKRSITGKQHVGGILGFGWIVANKVTNNQNVTGDKYVGGIVGSTLGSSKSSKINNSVNTGDITGNSYVGGIAGENIAAIVGTPGTDTNTGKITGNSYVGGIAGSNNGTLTDVTNAGEIIVNGKGDSIGGVAGKNSNSISGSTNNGTVTAPEATNVGGITGQNTNLVETSTNNATVTGKEDVGGCIGYNNSLTEQDAVADKLTNNGPVAGDKNVGGVIGLNKGQIKECVNSAGANVTGNTNVGGIAGLNQESTQSQTPGTTGTITKSENDANVTGETNVGGIAGTNANLIDASKNTGTVTGTEDVGGIAGLNTGKVVDSENQGKVVGVDTEDKVSTNVGGIAGENQGELTNSKNSGDVSGNKNVGGAAGTNANLIDASKNTGTVTGTEDVGGIAGLNTGKVVDSENQGKVVGVDTEDKVSTNVGGIAGENQGELTNSKNSGDVSGNKNVGGAAGENSGSVTDCTNTGKVDGKENVGDIVGHNTETGTVSNKTDDKTNQYNSGANTTETTTNNNYTTEDKSSVSNNYYVTTTPGKTDEKASYESAVVTGLTAKNYKKAIIKCGKYSYRMLSSTLFGKTTNTVELYKANKKNYKTIQAYKTVKLTINGTKMTYKVTQVSKNAFKKYTKATKVILSTNMVTIKDNAFYGCKKLTTVDCKSKKLKTIGAKAFYNCKKLKTVKMKSTKLTKVGKNAFKNINKKASFKAPKKSLKKYKKLLTKKTGFKKTMKVRK